MISEDHHTVWMPMWDLQPETEYTVKARFRNTLKLGSATFTTSHPKLGSISVVDVGRDSASVRVSLKGVDGLTKTVYVQYKLTSASSTTSSWATPISQEVTDSAVFELSGLESNTEYDVRAYFDPDFQNAFPFTREARIGAETWVEPGHVLTTVYDGGFDTPGAPSPLTTTLTVEDFHFKFQL